MVKFGKNELLLKALSFSFEFGFIIALPLISLGLLGRWLDTRFETGFWVIVGVFLALILSVVMIYKRLDSIRRDLLDRRGNP